MKIYPGWRLISTAASRSRRPLQGPWLMREVISQKGPVLVIDYKELEKTSLLGTSTIETKPETKGEPELITDFRQLGSFNWYGSPEKPIMIIPGAPKIFRSSWTGGQLKLDESEEIVARHVHMAPEHQMESTFVAIKKCAELKNTPCPNFNNYDIATDRHNLRALFDYCRRRGAFSPYPEDSGEFPGIRMDIERVGDRLVIMSRCEPRTHVLPCRKTFGQDFRAKITDEASIFSDSSRLLQALTSASPGATIFRQSQIVSYHFGHLKFLVRYNLHCIDPEKSRFLEAPVDQEATYSLEKIPGSNISYVYAGHLHHYHAVSLTTRHQMRPFPRFRWAEMYLSQTNTLAIGWYDRATWNVVPKVYSLEEVGRLAQENIEHLDDQGYNEKTMVQLHNLLYCLVDFVRCQPNGKKFAVIWPNRPSNKLYVFEKDRKSSRALPYYLAKDIL